MRLTIRDNKEQVGNYVSLLSSLFGMFGEDWHGKS